MPDVDINRIISVTQARANIASLVDDVIKTKKFYVLTRGGKPAVMLTPINNESTIGKKSSNKIANFNKELLDEDQEFDAKPPFNINNDDVVMPDKSSKVLEDEEDDNAMPKIDLSELDEALDSYEKSQATQSK